MVELYFYELIFLDNVGCPNSFKEVENGLFKHITTYIKMSDSKWLGNANKGYANKILCQSECKYIKHLQTPWKNTLAQRVVKERSLSSSGLKKRVTAKKLEWSKRRGKSEEQANFSQRIIVSTLLLSRTRYFVHYIAVFFKMHLIFKFM